MQLSVSLHSFLFEESGASAQAQATRKTAGDMAINLSLSLSLK
jgi:hypothetical protein